MNEQIARAYRYHRQNGYNARLALELARSDYNVGTRRYPSSAFYASVANRPFKSGSTMLRWIEKPASIGLRRVGYSDEIVRSIEHEGWYTNEFQDETMRGIVYQWPTRQGVERFVYGYEDPFHNGDAAALCFDVADNKEDAARWGDSVAQYAAEEEREYSAAANARDRYNELGDEVSDTRRSILRLVRELKENRRSLCDAPAIVAALQNSITDKLDTIREARKARSELRRDFSYHQGWAQG